MSERIVTLPNRETLTQNLLSISCHGFYQDHLYPMIVQHAEEEKTIPQLVKWLALVIMQAFEESYTPVGVIGHIYQFLPALIMDEEVREQAEDYLVQKEEEVFGSNEVTA
jgi:hypothetical protein